MFSPGPKRNKDSRILCILGNQEIFIFTLIFFEDEKLFT